MEVASSEAVANSECTCRLHHKSGPSGLAFANSRIAQTAVSTVGFQNYMLISESFEIPMVLRSFMDAGESEMIF
jgi:hypothetical protein